MVAWRDWLFNRPDVDVDILRRHEGFMMCLHIFYFVKLSIYLL